MFAFLLAACATQPTASAPAALLRTEVEPDGENCAEGGVAIHAGRDDDGDGTLSDAEIDTTEFVCDGATGSTGADGGAGADGASTLMVMSDEPAGDNCANGGVRVDAGTDDDADGVLDAEEIDTTEYVCHGDDGEPGLQTLVSVSEEPAGDNCPYGGQRLDTGADTDASGVLDAGEVTSTSYVCNGTPGSDGADGSDGAAGADAMVSTAEEPAGDNCAAGGIAISIGTDADGDGALDADEVAATEYVCDGESGSGSGGGIAGTIVAGDYTVANSLDADLLDGVEQITGTLTIYGVSMGDVEIPDVEQVGNLTIGANGYTFSPTSLSMPSLTTVDGDVTVYSIATGDFSGFDALTTVGDDVTVYPGTGVTTLSGFDGLSSVGDQLYVSAPTSLTTIAAFQGLVDGPTITITGYGVTDISGLSNLRSTTGTINLYSLPLTDLDDLASLTDPAGISLYSMTSLTDITALSNVTSVSTTLYLSDLSALSSLSGLENLTSASGASVKLYSLALVSDLSPLSNLTVAKSLQVYNMDLVTDLDGFASLDLEDGGSLVLQYNNLLSDLTGLGSVDARLNSLYINSNGSLTNLDGLEGITYLGYDSSAYSSTYGIYITGNTALADIGGLSGVTGIGYGYHDFTGNYALCTSLVTAWKTAIGASNILSTSLYTTNKSC